MADKGFVTKGSTAYFAERERRMQAHIDEARTNIDAIETKVRVEIAEINVQRERLRMHLAGFIDARNALAEHRNTTVDLITQLNAVVTICDADLPVLDSMLDELEGETMAADKKLEETEKGKARQLNKHVRKKSRYELRKTRLDLRRKLLGVDEAASTLDAMIEHARGVEMTPEQKEEQRRSFAFGNTHLENENVTKGTVGQAAEDEVIARDLEGGPQGVI